MGRKQKKNVPCPACKKKYFTLRAVQDHIQSKHPNSYLTPEVTTASTWGSSLNPALAAVRIDEDEEESDGTEVSQPLETEPIVLQLRYSLPAGSPWRILNDGRWRIFHHPGFPASGPLGASVERIQGLPGKTETISNVIINELDNSAQQTQAIVLSPTRETAQVTHMLVSSAAVASGITAHLSVGGTSIHEDRQHLKERPHIVVGTAGRLFAMLERKTIDPDDIKYLCVEGIQHVLGSKYENEFAEFCELLPKDIKIILLSTKIRYRTSHDFSKLFIHKPLHFLVKEDPAPEPSAIQHDQDPVGVDTNWGENTAQSIVRLDTNAARLLWFRCEVGRCRSKFPTKDDLRSHIRFFHWRTAPQPGEYASVANESDPEGVGKLLANDLLGDGVPHNKDFIRNERVMYLCGLCERYPPFKSSRAFGQHLERMHFDSGNVAVSKVGLATHSASDGPYMDTYLARRTEEIAETSEFELMPDPF